MVAGRLARGREIGADAFADITTTPCVEVAWGADGWLQATFDGDLTVTEQDAVRLRMASRDDGEETQRRQAAQSVAENLAYLAVATPTSEQVRTQVAALTRQVNALVRIITRDQDVDNEGGEQ